MKLRRLALTAMLFGYACLAGHAQTTPPELKKLSNLRKQFLASAKDATTWLTRMSTRSGYFLEGWQTALNKAIPGRHPLQQVEATLTLVRATHLFSDEKVAMRAMQSLTILLQSTKVDKESPSLRQSAHLLSLVDPIAYCSLLALAIYELPEPEDDKLKKAWSSYQSKADQLCNYLQTQFRQDGSLKPASPAGKAKTIDQQIRSAQAILALMKSYARSPQKWKSTLAKQWLSLSEKAWETRQDREVTSWEIIACGEAFLQTKEKVFADVIYRRSDWLCKLQYEMPLDADRAPWLGAFRISPKEPALKAVEPTSGDCGLCAQALVKASRVAEEQDDQARLTKYVASVELSFQFLRAIQFSQAFTNHFADWYRRLLLGGFRRRLSAGRLTLMDHQRALSALIQYFREVAHFRQS